MSNPPAFAGFHDAPPPAEVKDLCSCIPEDLNKAGPAIDAFLAGLDQTMDDAQKMDALTTWLQSHACIDDAYIACVSCIETNPTQSEIVVSFTESGVKKQLTLDILMSNPPRFSATH